MEYLKNTIRSIEWVQEPTCETNLFVPKHTLYALDSYYHFSLTFQYTRIKLLYFSIVQEVMCAIYVILIHVPKTQFSRSTTLPNFIHFLLPLKYYSFCSIVVETFLFGTDIKKSYVRCVK